MGLPKWLGRMAWKGLRTVGIAKAIGFVARGSVRLPKMATVRKEVLNAVDDAREASTDTSIALVKIRLAEQYVRSVGDKPPLPKTAIFGVIFAIASPFVLVGFGFLSSALAWWFYQSTGDHLLTINRLMWAWGIVGASCVAVPLTLAVVLCSRQFWGLVMWKIVRAAKREAELPIAAADE
jgi:hypothetical protein